MTRVGIRDQVPSRNRYLHTLASPGTSTQQLCALELGCGNRVSLAQPSPLRYHHLISVLAFHPLGLVVRNYFLISNEMTAFCQLICPTARDCFIGIYCKTMDQSKSVGQFRSRVDTLEEAPRAPMNARPVQAHHRNPMVMT